MDSDSFVEEEIDPGCFAELDAIEAAHYGGQKSTVQPPTNPRRSLPKEDSFCDLSFDVDDAELQRLDDFVDDTYNGIAAPVVRPKRRTPKNSRGTIQRTLFGDVLPSSTPSTSKLSKPRSPAKRTKSTQRNPFGQPAPKTKLWDQTAFAKSGLKRGKAKVKEDEGEGAKEEAVIEFEQFPAPFVSIVDHSGKPPSMKLKPDLLEAKHWIYPLNRPKRDYQFNIVKHCLFDNTLVSLPTGLGKTFIAGVVMLNYYRWFPEGKVIFVAPSKPLVAQQIEACHQTCGISGSDAAELTGNIPRPMRARAWREKRVFYMTPQTLVNDLVTENCDYSSIILLVIDEAHRGTGDYAYAQVIRFLMAKNPHFRVLALTATPGSTPDAVQAIVDSLHISHIEIRDENSLDLKEYVFKKNIKQHIIKMTEDVNKVKDLLANLMQDDIKQLRDRGILYTNGNPVTMHPYLPQASMQSLKSGQKWAYEPLSRLSSLARAMGYLIEASMGMCRTFLQELGSEKHNGDNSRKHDEKAQKLRSNPKFQAVTEEIELQHRRGFSLHPKMEMLKRLLIQHFGERMDDGSGPHEGTRAMVFVTYRECIDEIVDMFDVEKPLIRATRFVGQGTDKQGKKGYGQKEQLEVINKFKTGQFNVLVATSVGEEGLDIGEIDLIICYDAQKTPIRMLQRVGRTGRKREGHVHVLLSEEREEFNLDKAKATYKDVQKSITRGDQYELYGDVERLLPDHIKPECLQKVMDIVEYSREDERRKSNEDWHSHETAKKRKRNNDMTRNIPSGASTGFVSVADLLVKGAKMRKQKRAKDFDAAGQDDDTDEDLETGKVLVPLRRAVSGPATLGARNKGNVLRKASTMRTDQTSRKPRARARRAVDEPSLTQFMKKGVDDSDDMEIEKYAGLSRPSALSPLSPGRRRSRSPRSCSPSFEIENSVIELTSSENDHHSPAISPMRMTPSSKGPSIRSSSVSDNGALKREPGSDGGTDIYCHKRHSSLSPCIGSEHDGQDMAWLVDKDDDPSFEIIDASPNKKSEPSPARIEIYANRQSSSHKRRKKPQCDRRSDSDNYQSTSAHINQQFFSKSTRTTKYRTPTLLNSSAQNMSSSSSAEPSEDELETKMTPAESPRRSRVSSLDLPSSSPDSSFPVRLKGKQRIKLDVSQSSSPPMSPAVRRLHHQRVEHSPMPAPEIRKRSKPAATISKDLFDVEAVHSGDEVSSGSSHSDDDVEDEHDRIFLQDSPMTPAPPSYDQSIVYRQSLLTQAPDGDGPIFANRPIRHGAFGHGENSMARPRRLVVDSPARYDDIPDEYAIGSFVVDDDDIV